MRLAAAANFDWRNTFLPVKGCGESFAVHHVIHQLISSLLLLLALFFSHVSTHYPSSTLSPIKHVSCRC
ncbi:hypothetical protein INR49_004066 [Caranx melampygus]|nr:hypothetical protein INR49_004066 [Caranx melampygus]